MYSCWLIVGVPTEAADYVADHLHLVLWSKMQFLKNRLFLPHCSSTWLVVEYVLEVPTLQALNALVVHPDWVEGLPPLLVLVKDQVIQLLDLFLKVGLGTHSAISGSGGLTGTLREQNLGAYSTVQNTT